jgi:hypothetical protein
LLPATLASLAYRASLASLALQGQQLQGQKLHETLASARLPLAFLIFILYLKIRIKTARLELSLRGFELPKAKGAKVVFILIF